MSQVALTPKAKSDLSHIWDYTLAEWGIDQAEKYVRELWEAMQSQALDSSPSADIGDVRAEYRKVISGSHVVFFKLSVDGIDVIRILHQRMDFERHL
ncbi:MAG: type II toxin-antitoxin system RelE/ParE family toxin [Thermodesulfobacteriota bacterium]